MFKWEGVKRSGLKVLLRGCRSLLEYIYIYIYNMKFAAYMAVPFIILFHIVLFYFVSFYCLYAFP